MIRILALLLLCWSAFAQTPLEVRVGLSARVESVVLPGSEFEAAPISAKSPVVLRITAVWPHGSERRYDLEFYALDPGEYDLTQYLRRKDGTPNGELPKLPVRVLTSLPEGQVKPHSPQPNAPPQLGGYRSLLWVGGVLWLVGLLALLFLGRQRKPSAAPRNKPRSMADELRPLVEAALARNLSSGERSQLELRLLAFWRQRLGLEQQDPLQALAQLRQHEQAGALLRAMEAWLHAPHPPASVDLEALLAPYREER